MKILQFILRPLRAALMRNTNRPPDFTVGPSDNIYLKRWWVIRRNKWFNIYLHQFVRSDDDRALHDHMYVNASIILEGEYAEHTINAGGVNIRTRYSAGDVKFRRAASAHRIELTNGPSWSLFVTGPRIREWGFHCPAGWKHWEKFTKAGSPGEVGPGCEG